MADAVDITDVRPVVKLFFLLKIYELYVVITKVELICLRLMDSLGCIFVFMSL